MTPSFFKVPFLILIAFLVVGCGIEEPEPSNTPLVRLAKVTTSQGALREFTYGPSGELTRIKGTGELALHSLTASDSEVLYGANGRIGLIKNTGGQVTKESAYTYNGLGQLTKLEEKINGQVESYYTFEYDNAGRLAVRYSYFKDTNASSEELVATHKHSYVYNARGNVSDITVFQRSAPTAGWTASYTVKYENYDDSPCVQHLAGTPFTPGIVLQWNNPGKVTTTFQEDGRQLAATYTYEYDSQKLPVKKTTTPTTGDAVVTMYSYSY
ncbi:hypothetical protein [Rufibacter ruber]|uniref:hypothetical protein n=1 Tax=Rufibacter ruber TaxID=1783499 RepID=UPI0008316F9C|nr:hypothetical protein [Rufibacter ruber]